MARGLCRGCGGSRGAGCDARCVLCGQLTAPPAALWHSTGVCTRGDSRVLLIPIVVPWCGSDGPGLSTCPVPGHLAGDRAGLHEEHKL